MLNATNKARAYDNRTPEGRWTAVVVLDKTAGGYVGRYAGFVKV